MPAFARLAQLVHSAARDHFPPVTQEGIQHFLETEEPRLAIDQGHHVDAEYLLHGSLRIQIIQQNLRHFAALQLDHDTHAVFVGFIAQAVGGDAFDQLVANQVGDTLDQARLVHLVGQLGNDDGLALALAHILEMCACTQIQPPASRLIGLDDLLRAVYESGGGEIRARNDMHQLPKRDIRIFDQRDARRDDFRQIMRRDVGGHTHRNPGGPVDQQIRNPRRQDRRLALGFIIVRVEIDGFFIDVGKQLTRQPRHAHFCIAHRRRRIAVYRAEIALSIHQQIAHREVLRHAHDGVIDRSVAVRMVFTDDIPDHTRRFFIRPVPVIAEFAHRVQHPPVHRLQTISNVGQCASDDHAHRVIQIRFAHLVFEIYGQYFACDLGHLSRVR